MKYYLFITSFCFVFAMPGKAQVDTIFIKGNQQILCTKIKETTAQYSFTFFTAAAVKTKSNILKYLVDSIKYYIPVFDSNNTVKKRKKEKLPAVTENQEQTVEEKPWNKSVSFGINIGNVLEYNNPTGTDIKNLSLNIGLDLGLNYKKQGRKFEMTNELHYLFGIQKAGLSGGTHLQRVQDNLVLLHDFSIGIGKKNKWNFNLIARSETSVFTIFDGGYFKDFTLLGPIKAFASPYDITLSPGIKFQPNSCFRVSLSPYSFQLYGIKNSEISSKGIHITEVDDDGKYKNFVFRRLGAEVNFWYDKRVKQWLDIQYRLNFSSNYFEEIGKNGLMEGLFITKIKIFKAFYLTHRATIQGNLAVNFLKPYYNQAVLLSYTKSF